MESQLYLNNNIGFVSILKFIGSILIACFVHSYWIDVSGDAMLQYFCDISSFCVEMFFVISGMLFYLSTYKKIIFNNESTFKILKHKYLKIFPIMFVSTTIGFIIAISANKINGSNFLDYFAEIFFGGLVAWSGRANIFNPPLWFLSVLFMVYIFGVIISKIVKSHNKNYNIIFVIPIIIGFMIYFSKNHFLFWNLSNARGLIAFYIGVILMLLLEKIKNNKQLLAIKLFSFIVLLIYIPLFFVKFNMYDIGHELRCSIQAIFLFPPFFSVLYGLKINLTISKYLSLLSSYIYFFHFNTTLKLLQHLNVWRIGYWSFLLSIILNIIFSLILIYLFKLTSMLFHKRTTHSEL